MTYSVDQEGKRQLVKHICDSKDFQHDCFQYFPKSNVSCTTLTISIFL
jgi:hypothetical protein